MDNAEKNRIIELHKIARESHNHHDTINMQIYLALGVVISLFLAGVGFIFSRDFPLRQESVFYVILTKSVILVLFGITEWYFCRAFRDRAKAFEQWDEVISKTANKLPEETSEGLLIGADPHETADSNKKRLLWYMVFFIVAFIALGVFLFVFIK